MKLLTAALAGIVAIASPAPAAEPDDKTRNALDILVMGQLAAKACVNLRLNFGGMTAVIQAVGLKAADTTRLYGQTVGELGERYSKAASENLGAFCTQAFLQLGPEGTRAHMLERTDTQ